MTPALGGQQAYCSTIPSSLTFPALIGAAQSIITMNELSSEIAISPGAQDYDTGRLSQTK